MAKMKDLMDRAYAAFNGRDVDGILALMSDDVSWPKASEGGSVVGKDQIRAYWMRQWAEFDPHVEPVGITEPESGKAVVSVHQVVKNLGGEVISDLMVTHVYTIADGVIGKMELGENVAAFGQGHAE